jgi:hypothetical protein
MVKLNGYHHFSGRHWETGSVCNYYAFSGLQAPHTGHPYSEALLLGISGGIVMGYFSFAYEGYDPHVALLTRNTLDPLDTLLERLGVEQEILQTSLPEKGRANLIGTLESGLPAICWVDIFSLPYLEIPNDDDMYMMLPVLVYGYEEAQDTAWIADRARVPLGVSIAQLEAARARVKKDKFRVMTLGDPDPHKLAAAVQKGIWDTIRLFTEQPPKGSKNNFGFSAYAYWQELLFSQKHKSSWAQVFPPGRKMGSGLVSAFQGIIQNGEGDGAERDTYADFLEEASLILTNPGLIIAAELFRESARVWRNLGRALLPDNIPPFQEIRELLLKRKELFLSQGGGAQKEIAEINSRLKSLKQALADKFPLQQDVDLRQFMEQLRENIQNVSDTENKAVQALQDAMNR